MTMPDDTRSAQPEVPPSVPPALQPTAGPAASGALRRGTGYVLAEPLAVAPALIGQPLARPQRRAWALGLDLLLIAALSAASLWWLALGVAVLAFVVRWSMLEEGIARRWAQALAAALLVVALGVAWQAWRASQADARRAEREAALPPSDKAKAAKVAKAQAAMTEVRDEVSRALAESGVAVTPAASAAMARLEQAVSASVTAKAAADERKAAARRKVDAASTTAGGSSGGEAQPAQRSDAERIAELEQELAAARAAEPESGRGWRATLTGLLDDLGLGFGWSIVYFSLLPALWRGQTVGKRLFGLRIVVLSGERLTPLRGLKRYGGYVAGMATGGLGFAQVLWEPNRQALHDKAAHTVVLDARRRPAVAAAALPETPAPAATQERPECKPPSTNA